jgi:hypothetical protein
MSKSYENTKLWLNDYDFEMISNVESYNSNKAFDFKCNKGHLCTLTVVAYYVRKSKAKINNKKLWLCDSCRPRVSKVDYVNLGEQKFKNYCGYLEHAKYKVKSTFEDFTQNKIAFDCLQGHTTTTTVKYFGVRKFSRVVLDDPRLLCGHCNVKGEILADKLEALQISVKKKTGHKILTLERGRKITYECGTCGEISESSSQNLTSNTKETKYCSNCAHNNYNQTCFQRKPFMFPSGRIDNVLGHEPLCLKELLNHYKEEDIITDTKVIPTFFYDKTSKTTGEKYKGRYYPDILLPDKIIEVKSEFTFNLDKENNLRKMDAVVEQGHNFEFWIYNNKKELKVIRKDKCC